MTPYQRWTGRIPSLDGLLTFGATIVSKKAKKRDTATDPNLFHGIFLGYRATMDNIVYWDTKSQSKHTAKHKTADEVQYSDPPAQRSPASKHLIEIITGTPHMSRRTDILLETVTECIDEATIKPSTDNFRTLIDSPLPFNAAAAAAKTKAKFDRPDPAWLTSQLRYLDVTLNMYEPAISEFLPLQGTHPTLGMKISTHPDYTDTVILQRLEPGTVSFKLLKAWR